MIDEKKLIERLKRNAFSLTYNFVVEKYLKFDKAIEIVGELTEEEEHKECIAPNSQAIDDAFKERIADAIAMKKEIEKPGNSSKIIYAAYSKGYGDGYLLKQERLAEYQSIGTVDEFKALKEKEERFDRNIKMFNEIGLKIRNKAIDEMQDNLIRNSRTKVIDGEICFIVTDKRIKQIAEMMKGEL